ncbi:hypothetical protein BBK82_42305 [Lentzea guizhouensis]|uniref:Uncharacterized protein n=1 Tax=Lentzea guizhouensis TaxID=1586287 RepID=A0A1B2HV37_9PSEU|nr:hypothetical protein [Lentzea guizhouensis]ANZ41604.1 hypothetical protein BBK82_42305 [Lentzea guizhouensis]
MTTSHDEETPDIHGFVLMGEQVVHGGHLAMFTMAAHRYQVVATFGFGAEAKKTYVEARKAARTATFVVVNQEKLLLPKMLADRRFTGTILKVVGNDLHNAVPIVSDTPVEITSVLYDRQFQDSGDYPPKPSYLLFGDGSQAHATHYMTKKPDYQLLVAVSVSDSELTAAELAAGVLVELQDVTENHTPATTPIPPDTVVHALSPQGKKVTLTVTHTHWFDTRELNGPTNYSASLLVALETAAV